LQYSESQIISTAKLLCLAGGYGDMAQIKK